jgi:hypothetical protein
VKRNFKPKIRKISPRTSFLKQSPSFTTDKHIPTMNSQGQHILRRPNFQDLRRLKFTRKNSSEKGPKPTNLQVLHKSPQRASFGISQPVMSTFGETSS